ncbi:MAG: 3-oxocholest-4-en-26-oate--CoA ligase [Acidimicrobiales bacterium]|nr:MAG: acyl-CoA synthetase [Actinomycetota bacterium]MBV6507835.1 3-oxocholest-4-en-26-oate--CoA ligase [Acidimicrobiales bacterium]RIK05987.1 MAG: acyl-CoA synthetase [Acidobacteriota bacterium]
MSYNIADLFEHAADAVPERLALVCDDVRLTFRELDDRASRLAHFLSSEGIGRGDHVGIYANNSAAWVETMYASFKARAIPININFRYIEGELAYILDNADLKAIVFDRRFAPRLAAVRDSARDLQTLVRVDDPTGTDLSGLDAIDYEQAVAAGSPARDFAERSPDDLYVLYTGGTTGMPKGVMWRQEDVFMALGGGIDQLSGVRVSDDHTLADQAAESGGALVFLVIPPLMHGAAQWATMGQHFRGNTIVLLPSFDPAEVWRLVEEYQINSLIITGDAMGRPIIEWLEDNPDAHDVSSLISVSSSAAIFSPTVKDRFLDRFGNLVITDSIGSTESGFNGIAQVGKGQTQLKGGGPTVAPGPDLVILDEHLEVIPEGSSQVGRIGRGGNIPLGYYKDEEKTRSTFVVAADGRRYSMPGDFARWEADGHMTLLGRGSVSINSGGEKIYPEEVEQALKDHPAVFDCLVVGVPDDRWGQRVAAVVQFRKGRSAGLEELCEHARKHIAGYKVPREMHQVDVVVRSPSGKPDYPWATRVARGELMGS